jgi:hypothetical protein
MKIDIIITTLAFSFCSTLLGQKVELTAIDEQGQPVVNAELQVIYNNPKAKERYDTQIKQSDDEGQAVFWGDGLQGVSVWGKKEGYYAFGHRPAERSRISSTDLKGGAERNVLLRRILNPISLYVKYAAGGVIPLQNEWVGYDLEKGDWLKPHGIGETADILFRYEKEFQGIRLGNWSYEKNREEHRMRYERQGKHWDEDVFRYDLGKWDGILEISFPGDKEGIVKVDEGFIEQSVLPMPHLAREEGYAPSHVYEEKNYQPSTHRDDVGFFLRSRVVLDRQGNIESANYAKIYSDFTFDPRGKVSFTYYFNPTPNDRNLEFIGDNLFSDSSSAQP